MKSKVLYISSACSKKTFDSVEKNKKMQKFVYGMPVAANKFHNLIMKGFVLNNYEVTSLVGIPVSNKSHTKKLWKSFSESENNITYKYLGFINFPFIKQIGVGISCFNNILKWNRNNKDGKKIIIYDAAYVSIIPFIMLANKFSKCKTIAIFSDIYNYMADVDTKNTNYNFIGKLIRKIMKVCYKKTDGYVFLSEQMNKLINNNGNPYCVIEGIVDSSISKLKDDAKENYIMYAGALRKEYGLEILLNGFQKYNNKNIELRIYGDGDYKEEIIQAGKIDNRIKYMGSVSNEKILKAEKKAILLVNPRPSNATFTSYSFPSKLMEYMSSGTAVLTTKLPTIPNEYKKYMYFINNETENGIKEVLNSTLKFSKKELEDFGSASQEFVLKYKSESVQAKKIIRLFGDNND